MIIQGKADAKQKSREMIATIKDERFWRSIQRIVLHLEPLALAANITQATFCRLDQVVLTFVHLYMSFSKLTEAIDQPVKHAVIASLEKRWSAADQDVFIASVYLNPFVKNAAFNNDLERFMPMRKTELLERLYRRFMPGHALSSHEMWQDSQDYENNRGHYRLMAESIHRIRSAAEAQNKSVNPKNVYSSIHVPGHEPPLTQLVYHIFAICPNSATCERLFSTFGNILTDKRTRLSRERLTDLAELKLHIRDEHLQLSSNLREEMIRRSRSIIPPKSTVTFLPIPAESTGEPEAVNPGHGSSEEFFGSESNPSTRLFQRMVNDIQELEESDPPSSSSVQLPINSLGKIFNISSPFWMTYDQRSATSNLEKQLQVLDLVEQEGMAEEMLDFEIDPTISSVLLS